MKKNNHNPLNNRRLCGTVPIVRYWVPVYLYAGLIFFHSSLSAPPIIPKILYGDKLFHFAEFALLAYLIARAAKNSANLKLRTHFRLFAVILTILYGISDELHQYFVPGRMVEFSDVLADSAGALIGQIFLRG